MICVWYLITKIDLMGNEETPTVVNNNEVRNMVKYYTINKYIYINILCKIKIFDFYRCQFQK